MCTHPAVARSVFSSGTSASPSQAALLTQRSRIPYDHLERHLLTLVKEHHVEFFGHSLRTGIGTNSITDTDGSAEAHSRVRVPDSWLNTSYSSDAESDNRNWGKAFLRQVIEARFNNIGTPVEANDIRKYHHLGHGSVHNPGNHPSDLVQVGHLRNLSSAGKIKLGRIRKEQMHASHHWNFVHRDEAATQLAREPQPVHASLNWANLSSDVNAAVPIERDHKLHLTTLKEHLNCLESRRLCPQVQGVHSEFLTKKSNVCKLGCNGRLHLSLDLSNHSGLDSWPQLRQCPLQPLQVTSCG
mmetsp:Transcript_4668/g.11039  ORF Transcript_4668/g.11039 Transcript_4668/m.11039 type:complete len:299 (+) Transcript_4668:1381-2277(+)